MNTSELINYFGDSVSDCGILLILVVIDTTLAVTYRMGKDQKFISSKMLSGILRNAILSVVPLGIRAISLIEPRKDDLYVVLSAFFFIFIAWGILASILSYVNLLGVKYPDWMIKILGSEIESKAGKKDGVNSDR